MAETPDSDRRLPDMPTTVLTCAEVEGRDLEAAYLSRRLSEEEAAAYEAHYFGCERCWESLRVATEARATIASAPPQRRWGAQRWWLAAAASVIVVAGGWWAAGRGPVTDEITQLRGPRDSLSVRSAVQGRTLSASWGAVPGASVYMVRLYATDGAMLLQRETLDTAFSVVADSVTIPATSARIVWQVQALDQLRQPIARSPLTAGDRPTPR